jgi:hypothetical protein
VNGASGLFQKLVEDTLASWMLLPRPRSQPRVGSGVLRFLHLDPRSSEVSTSAAVAMAPMRCWAEGDPVEGALAAEQGVATLGGRSQRSSAGCSSGC